MSTCSTTSDSERPRKRQKEELPPSLPFYLYRLREKEQLAQTNVVETHLEDWFDGDPVYAFLSNFVVDLDWLISAAPSLRKIPDILLAHGETEDSHLHEAKRKHGITQLTLHKPPLPIPYGCHHSKACVLKFLNGIRIVIHTANLIYKDCGNKTQGVWIQDFPLKETSDIESEFEVDLINYILRLRLPKSKNQQLLGIIKQHDFSTARGKLIASVPGYHKGGSLTSFGHLRVQQMLENEIFDEQFEKAPIVCQFSSLGSLDEKWLFNEFRRSLSQGKSKNQSKLGTPERGGLQLIWPTINQVKESFEGWLAGRSIPGVAKNVQKPFLQPLWHKFDGRSIGRSDRMPHIKSYTRYQNGQMAWMLLTSHNLSKAAWGVLQKGGSQLMIRSYELGILLLPSLEEKYWNSPERHFSCSSSSTATGGIPEKFTFVPMSSTEEPEGDIKVQRSGIPCPIPFLLPPSCYGTDDQPWTSDTPYVGLDALGNEWGSPNIVYGMLEDDG